MSNWNDLERSTRLFVIILVVAVVVAAGGWITTAAQKPFSGEFDKVPLTQVKGELLQVKSKENIGQSFKFTWQISVTEAVRVNPNAPQLLPDLQPGDVINAEVADSRANNFIETLPADCYQADQSIVRVCTYTVTQRSAIVIIAETLGSNGLPELAGTPR